MRSPHGRLASRLSVGVTDFLTARLAASRPGALVTDQPQTETPGDRLVIHMSRFDIESDGTGTLEADWLIVPGDKSLPIRRDRARVQASGAVTTDQDVVTFEQSLLEQLAQKIGRSF